MKVTIFSTKGRKQSVVNTTSTTWGELKSVLSAEGIETDNMKAIIGENQVTLESSKAVLPVDFDFTLFLTPIKVKNGVDVASMTYKECREFIKANGGVEVFGNYTRFSTEEARAQIANFLGKKVNVEVTSTPTEAIDVFGIIDQCIDNLNALKSVIAAGTQAPEEDLVSHLEEWFNEIKSNL